MALPIRSRRSSKKKSNPGALYVTPHRKKDSDCGVARRLSFARKNSLGCCALSFLYSLEHTFREGGLFAMPKTVIRPATLADLPSILRLYRVLDEELVDLQPEFFCAAPREEEPIRRFIEAMDADFLLAEQEGEVVGLALVLYAGWTAEFSCVLPHRYASLNDLVVLREKRCQGIGSSLLGAAKRWARDRRLEYLELDVLSQNSNAIELYEAHDFVESTRTMRCML